MADKKVLVAGSGTMGAGIAQVFAATGYKVALFDISKKFLDRAMAKTEKGLTKRASKGIITEDAAKAALGAIEPATSLEGLLKAARNSLTIFF